MGLFTMLSGGKASILVWIVNSGLWNRGVLYRGLWVLGVAFFQHLTLALAPDRYS
jgi:hypothetical protein